MAIEVNRLSEPQPAVGQLKTGCCRSGFGAECQRQPGPDVEVDGRRLSAAPRNLTLIGGQVDDLLRWFTTRWDRKMKRRDAVLASLVLGSQPFPVWTQQPGKVWRMGVLSLSIGNLDSFFSVLAKRGYKVGGNLIVDYKFAQGQVERLPALAAELVAAKPDLLLGPLNVDVVALKRATQTIPIVMMFAWGPVESGLVASLARPGGNVTGTTTNSFEAAGKMTQVLLETVPGLSSLQWLSDPDYPGMSLARTYGSRAGASKGVKVTHVDVRTVTDLDTALADLRRNRPDALGVAMTGPLLENVNRVIEVAAQLRLPTLYSTSGPVLIGGLMSYGPDFSAVLERIAAMIDKILKGAKPSDMPVEEPAKFQLTINMKTARAMGLVIPQIVLLQATELIE